MCQRTRAHARSPTRPSQPRRTPFPAPSRPVPRQFRALWRVYLLVGGKGRLGPGKLRLQMRDPFLRRGQLLVQQVDAVLQSELLRPRLVRLVGVALPQLGERRLRSTVFVFRGVRRIRVSDFLVISRRMCKGP